MQEMVFGAYIAQCVDPGKRTKLTIYEGAAEK